MPNIHIFTLTLEAGETEQIRSKGWCNWLGSCHSTRISAAGGIPCLRNPQFSGQRQAISDNAYGDYSVEAKQTVGPKSIPKMASWLLRRDGAC
ncbi:hypothetical protein M9X92_004867 [Pyricularia oryzae]|nr:hypothetical protein M9X92_004867 [Pyricularia oryzae]